LWKWKREMEVKIIAMDMLIKKNDGVMIQLGD
jgi:hypothetical protein